MTPVALSPFGRRHLAATLTWANDPGLARLLARSRAITSDEHEQWFATLPGRRDTLFLAIETGPERRHVGNVWLADIDRRQRKAEVRIVIGADGLAGSGVGTNALKQMATYAFATLELHRVYAYVLAFNPRARRAFEKAGFLLEGTLRHDRFDGEQFCDTFLLGRLSDDQ